MSVLRAPARERTRGPEMSHGALLATIVVWSVAAGASFVFIRGAQRGLGPMVMLDLALWVGLLAALAATALRGGTRWPMARATARRQLVLVLVTTCVPYPLISWAQDRVSAATTIVIVATIPLIGAWLARVRPPYEKVSPAAAAGLLVGLAGVAVVAGQPGGATVSGVVAIAAATVLFAVGFVLAKGLCPQLEGHDSLELCVRHLAIAAVVLTPAAAADALTSAQHVTAANLLYVTGLGVIGYAYSYYVYYVVIRRTTVAHASLVSYLQPVAGIVLAWLLLGEAIGAPQVVGIALIIAGVGVVDAAHRREAATA